MSIKSSDEGPIRKRITEIDQHISVLMKERDELIFAERVLGRLGGAAPAPEAPARTVDADGIEEALARLESR